MKLIVFDLDNTVFTRHYLPHAQDKLSHEQRNHLSNATNEFGTLRSPQQAATSRQSSFLSRLCCISPQEEQAELSIKLLSARFLYKAEHFSLFYKAHLHKEHVRLIFVTAGKYEEKSLNRVLQTEIQIHFELKQQPEFNFSVFNYYNLSAFGYTHDSQLQTANTKALAKARLIHNFYSKHLPTQLFSIVFIDDFYNNRLAVDTLFQKQCITIDPTASNYQAKLERLSEELESTAGNWPEELISDSTT